MDFLDWEYQSSGSNGLKPLSLAYASKNFLLFFASFQSATKQLSMQVDEIEKEEKRR